MPHHFDYLLLRFVKTESQIDLETLYIIGRRIKSVLTPQVINVPGCVRNPNSINCNASKVINAMRIAIHKPTVMP